MSSLVILIVLYSIIEEAVKALKFALETNLIIENDISIKWKIKPHPLSYKTKLLDAIEQPVPESWEWMENDFHECLDEVDIIMGNASTTCMEALAREKFVIIIGNPHGLTHNPVHSSVPNELWKLCYSPSEAAEALKRCTNDFKPPSSNSSIRDAFFEPVTKEGVVQMIDIQLNV